MAAIHSDAFTRDAVRIAPTRGLTRRQVASDLGVGLSTLNKWVKAISDEAGPPDPDQNLLRENERLRRENRILKDLSRISKQSGGLFARRMRELLKKATVGSTGQRNGSFEGISRRLEAKRFPGPRVEPQGNLIEVTLGVNG